MYKVAILWDPIVLKNKIQSFQHFVSLFVSESKLYHLITKCERHSLENVLEIRKDEACFVALIFISFYLLIKQTGIDLKWHDTFFLKKNLLYDNYGNTIDRLWSHKLIQSITSL